MSVLTKRKRGRPRLDESREINDFDASLVEAVKKFPIFYDKKHPHYRNRENTEHVWEIVADNLKVSVNVVKNRMFQLRNRYNVEKRRVFTMSHQQPGVASSWPLFENLQYLSEYNENGLATDLSDNVAPAISSSDAEDDDEEEDDRKKNGNNTTERKGYITTSDNIELLQQPDLLQSPAPDTEEFNFEMPVITQMDNNQHMKKFEAFGQFLASSLTELNEMQALHLVKKFTTDLVEYSKLGEGNKVLRTNMQPSPAAGEEEHVQQN